MTKKGAIFRRRRKRRTSRDASLDIFKEEKVEREVAAGISERGAALTRLSNAKRESTRNGVANVEIVKTGFAGRRFGKKGLETSFCFNGAETFAY